MYLVIVSVAFYARVRADSTGNPSGTTVVFDDVRLNAKNAYNPSNGVFTCPRDGVYYFIWKNLVFGTHSYLTLTINGSNKQSLFNANTGDSSTGFYMTKLAKGDRVYVTHSSGGYEHGAYTSFSGFFLPGS